MQHGDGNHHVPLRFLFDKYAFESFERAPPDADGLPFTKKRARLGGKPGTENRLHGLDLRIRNGSRLARESDDRHHIGRGKNRQPSFWIETAEKISREERLIGFDDPVGPAPPPAVYGQVLLEAFIGKNRGSDFFVLGPGADGKPGKGSRN
jgi:hypothetical protein